MPSSPSLHTAELDAFISQGGAVNTTITLITPDGKEIEWIPTIRNLDNAAISRIRACAPDPIKEVMDKQFGKVYLRLQKKRELQTVADKLAGKERELKKIKMEEKALAEDISPPVSGPSSMESNAFEREARLKAKAEAEKKSGGGWFGRAK